MNAMPNIRYLEHESSLLKGNPRNDPHVRRLPIYLPPAYDEKRSQPYPVVFVLAGYGGRGAGSLNDAGVFSLSLPERLDQAITAEEMSAAILVFPDCGTKLGGSQYVDSSSNGPYMRYLVEELVPFVDRHFNTFGEGSHRGVTGHSSGGFGSMVLGMKHPDVFPYICSSAGDTWYEYLYLQLIPKCVRTLKRSGGVGPFIEKFLESPNPFGLLKRDDGETMMTLAICSCFAPNPGVPHIGGDLYFDERTGALIPEVWEKILAWDPVRMVQDHVENLRKLKWISLEAGVDDEYGLDLGHRQFAKQLDRFNISVELKEYPGRHGGHTYRYVERVKRMLGAMKV